MEKKEEVGSGRSEWKVTEEKQGFWVLRFLIGWAGRVVCFLWEMQCTSFPVTDGSILLAILLLDL